jgi:hypothetical protein
MKRVTAICKTGEDANRAVEALIESSFASEDLSILRVTGNDVDEIDVGQKTAIPVTLPTGIAVGASVGVGLVLSGVLPGIGLLAAGPIFGALQGLALGGAAGSLVGMLAGLGWWKAEADIPVDDLQRGGLLVGISVPDERAQDARDALEGAGASRVTVA